MNGALQKFIFTSLPVSILYSKHYSVSACHAGKKMLGLTLHECYLPHMVNNSYHAEADCQYCAE